jgi:hypothetical protein
MKLHEVFSIDFEPEDNEESEPAYSGRSSGYYYDVFGGNDPHEVVKKQKYDAEEDEEEGHSLYLQRASAYSGNPFFPKVYDSKISDEGKHHYTMERLLPFGRLSVEALISQFRYFNYIKSYESVDHLVDVIRFLCKEEGEFCIKDKICGVLSEELERVIVESRWDAINDEHLLKALMVIYDLWIYFSVHLDLHSDNIMFRGSPHGPQLVITDPLTGV